MRLKHHLLRWLLILTCVSMTAGHVTTVYAQESSSDSSSSSDSGSSSSTDGSVGETFENADHSNSVNAGAPSAPGSSGVSDGAGSAASTAAPSYNGYSYSPSPSYGGSMPSTPNGSFNNAPSFGGEQSNGGQGVSPANTGMAGYNDANPGYEAKPASDNMQAPSVLTYGGQTDPNAGAVAGFNATPDNGVMGSPEVGGLPSVDLGIPSAPNMASVPTYKQIDTNVGAGIMPEAKPSALADPLAPLNISVTKDNAADVFAGATWKSNGFSGLSTVVDGTTYYATPAVNGNGYTITTPTNFADNWGADVASDAPQNKPISRAIANHFAIDTTKAFDAITTAYKSIIPANKTTTVSGEAAGYFVIGGAAKATVELGTDASSIPYATIKKASANIGIGYGAEEGGKVADASANKTYESVIGTEQAPNTMALTANAQASVNAGPASIAVSANSGLQSSLNGSDEKVNTTFGNVTGEAGVTTAVKNGGVLSGTLGFSYKGSE